MKLLRTISSQRGSLSTKGIYRGTTDDVLTELSIADESNNYMIIDVSDMTTGEQLKMSRLMQGMTMKEAGEILGITVPYMSKLESGKVNIPDTLKYKLLNFINMDY